MRTGLLKFPLSTRQTDQIVFRLDIYCYFGLLYHIQGAKENMYWANVTKYISLSVHLTLKHSGKINENEYYTVYSIRDYYDKIITCKIMAEKLKQTTC